MSGRDQAAIMILLAMVIAAGFIIIDQRNRINELSQVYEHTQFELDHMNARYEYLYDSYQDLDDIASSYRRQIIQLNQEMDKIKNYEPQWRELTDRYSELLLEVARLNSLLLMNETGNNLTSPVVEPRKEEFRIGDTLAFYVESEYALYGSYFEIYYPNGTLCWESDPISEWAGLDDIWVSPYYGQTAYKKPMTLYEGYPLGNWTYVYWFGEIKMGEGWFIVLEAADQKFGTGITDISEEEGFLYVIPDLGGPTANLTEILENITTHQSIDKEYPLPYTDQSETSQVWLYAIIFVIIVSILALNKTR